MMSAVALVLSWLNAAANWLGTLLAPIGWMPGWASMLLVSAVTGVLLLLAFKYTSNQKAIRLTRNYIDANLLSASLFPDNASLAFGAQGRVLLGAGRLFVLALVPTAVMLVPVTLVLAQLGLWYQAQPLHVDDVAVVTLKLRDKLTEDGPKVTLDPGEDAEIVDDPVRVFSKGEICWKVKAKEPGYHTLHFEVDGQTFEKELAVGDGVMRVSIERPAFGWYEMLIHPAETPFDVESSVQWISVQYENRDTWLSAADWWVMWWFVLSMAIAFCFKGALGVNV
jgi:hypothetical protein